MRWSLRSTAPLPSASSTRSSGSAAWGHSITIKDRCWSSFAQASLTGSTRLPSVVPSPTRTTASPAGCSISRRPTSAPPPADTSGWPWARMGVENRCCPATRTTPSPTSCLRPARRNAARDYFAALAGLVAAWIGSGGDPAVRRRLHGDELVPPSRRVRAAFSQLGRGTATSGPASGRGLPRCPRLLTAICRPTRWTASSWPADREDRFGCRWLVQR